MISVCAGLVTLDEESQIIRLAYDTTTQYFEYALKRVWLSNAESAIARICMTYISFDTLENPSREGNIVSSFPFLQYAVDYTLTHMFQVVKSSKRAHTLFRINNWFLSRLSKLTDWVYHDNNDDGDDLKMIRGQGGYGSPFHAAYAQRDSYIE
ncbi:uncharacterized protein ACHE_80608A [Aspergillus chevalieri]|uniref:C6 transcription factor n=1 Tax=Aspergillus chevalieri TaxID=182096 RepID=A0A7R7VYM5_ASPCH|nr:uncharacterized protein ACHE_80608A [Aspergillus chevalieri]BCR92708.1 hypothetical protein ACHE_80608A [Aspergillus chevalieri]